jgi:hypothetical protein
MDLEKRLLAMVNSERSDKSTNFVRFEDPK